MSISSLRFLSFILLLSVFVVGCATEEGEPRVKRLKQKLLDAESVELTTRCRVDGKSVTRKCKLNREDLERYLALVHDDIPWLGTLKRTASGPDESAFIQTENPNVNLGVGRRKSEYSIYHVADTGKLYSGQFNGEKILEALIAHTAANQ
jgi:hypothetical protein